MTATEALRAAMVERQIAARGISDPALLEAMRDVPREMFVPDAMREFAYVDSPLPIEAGQTISQPYIVALMIEAACISPADRVLEIGLGSGYAAAVMSRIAGQVYAIDQHAELTALAHGRMAELGCDNVTIRTADGTAGWPEAAPFDAILVAAGGPQLPRPLCRQLAIGGRLVMPVGDVDVQRLMRATRPGKYELEREDLGAVHFMPLVGAHGWKDGARE